jgi:formate hydrogenlyase subunit 4
MMKMVLFILLHWLVILAVAPFFLGVINRVKAFFAGRQGPSVFQPYFDLARLFQKKCVYSRTATWVFHLAPVVVVSGVLVLSLMVPLGALKAPVVFSGDIFLLAYLLALSRFFIIASALDTGSSFEGMGASREAFFSCLSELALFMNFVTLALLTGSISLTKMIGSDVPMPWSVLGPALILVVASLFIVLLAENCRIPVDDPETHLELTMIHEVMILDHSGVDFGYMLYGAAMKLFVLSSILVPIIVPVKTGLMALDMLLYLGGMLGMALFIGVVESCMARLRLNRVGNLLLIAFALAFFGFVVTLWRS